MGKGHLVNSTLILAYSKDPLDNPESDFPQKNSPLKVTLTPSLIKIRKNLSGIWSVEWSQPKPTTL